MRLGTVRIRGGAPRVVGKAVSGHVIDISEAGQDLGLVGRSFPGTMVELLELGAYGMHFVRDLEEAVDRRGDTASAPWAYDEDEVTFLAPIPRPGKIFCFNANRGNRGLDPLNAEIQDEWPHPLFFIKAQSAVTGHRSVIKASQDMRPIQVEGEVCLFVNRRAKNIAAVDAWSIVAGCSLLNDISAGRFTLQDGAVLHIARGPGKPTEPMPTRQMARAKGPDGFCPIGPWLIPMDDVAGPFEEIEVVTEVGKNIVQRGLMASHRFTAERCIEWITRWMTLEPGDVISLGAFDQLPDFPLRDVDLAADSGQTALISSPQLGRLETTVALLPD